MINFVTILCEAMMFFPKGICTCLKEKSKNLKIKQKKDVCACCKRSFTQGELMPCQASATSSYFVVPEITLVRAQKYVSDDVCNRQIWRPKKQVLY